MLFPGSVLTVPSGGGPFVMGPKGPSTSGSRSGRSVLIPKGILMQFQSDAQRRAARRRRRSILGFVRHAGSTQLSEARRPVKFQLLATQIESVMKISSLKVGYLISENLHFCGAQICDAAFQGGVMTTHRRPSLETSLLPMMRRTPFAEGEVYTSNRRTRPGGKLQFSLT